jgi:hypothetical protein
MTELLPFGAHLTTAPLTRRDMAKEVKIQIRSSSPIISLL